MAITISGSGITSANIVDGTIVDADVADVAASKLTGALPAIDGSALTGVGKVLQVHHFEATPASTWQSSSASFVQVSGMSTTFTPSQSGGYLLVTAILPCELYGPSTNDVYSYTAIWDNTLGNVQQHGHQGDNLGKLGDLIWLPTTAVHYYKITHGSTATRTLQIRIANNTTSQQVRMRAGEHTGIINIMEISG